MATRKRKAISQREARGWKQRAEQCLADLERIEVELRDTAGQRDSLRARLNAVRAGLDALKERDRKVQFRLGDGTPVARDKEPSAERLGVIRTAWALGRVVLVRAVEPWDPNEKTEPVLEYFAAVQV